jgi:hypothetical protein
MLKNGFCHEQILMNHTVYIFFSVSNLVFKNTNLTNFEANLGVIFHKLTKNRYFCRFGEIMTGVKFQVSQGTF